MILVITRYDISLLFFENKMNVLKIDDIFGVTLYYDYKRRTKLFEFTFLRA